MCLFLFQSMLMKIMFATAVLCSSGPVPCAVAADDVTGDHADDIDEDAIDEDAIDEESIRASERTGDSETISEGV